MADAESTVETTLHYEAMHFVTREAENLTAFDLVNALAGVTSVLDYGFNSRNADHDRNVMAGLATSARILAEQLLSRLNGGPIPKRRRVQQ